MASQIDVAAPWSHPQAAEWDAITVKDFVEQQTLSADTDSLRKCYFQPSWGSDAGNVSMLLFAWFIATAGNEDNVGTFQRSSGTADAAQDSRFKLGSQTVPIRMARELGDRVALRAHVRHIVQRDGWAHVHTDRGTAVRSGSSSPARRRSSSTSTGHRSSRHAAATCSRTWRWAT
jgi:monoamine oxidase